MSIQATGRRIYSLDRLDDLLDAVQSNWSSLYGEHTTVSDYASFVADGMYRPFCGGSRRMRVCRVHPSGPIKDQPDRSSLSRTFPIMVFQLECVQCDTTSTAVVHPRPAGPALAVLPSVHGGLTTPHTPASVAFYIDQAHRSEAVGAHSAAVAMYRAALEQLLYEQRFTRRMLGNKISDLEDLLNGKSVAKPAEAPAQAPKWAHQLNSQFLSVLGELGNASTHPNDGDVSKQEALDKALLSRVMATIIRLLDLVYEAPAREAADLAALTAAASSFKTPAASGTT